MINYSQREEVKIPLVSKKAMAAFKNDIAYASKLVKTYDRYLDAVSDNIISNIIEKDPIIKIALESTRKKRTFDYESAKEVYSGNEYKDKIREYDDKFANFSDREALFKNFIKSNLGTHFFSITLRKNLVAIIAEMETKTDFDDRPRSNFLSKKPQQHIRPSTLLNFKKNIQQSAGDIFDFIYNGKPSELQNIHGPCDFGRVFGNEKPAELYQHKDKAAKLLEDFNREISSINLSAQNHHGLFGK